MTTAGSWSAPQSKTWASTRTRPRVTLLRLVDLAVRLCPVLKEAEIETTWAGLRPGSFDSKPYIGRAPGFDNLLVASGHKRAGLQLAPATAELVVDLILDRKPRLDLGAFRIDREPEMAGDMTFRS